MAKLSLVIWGIFVLIGMNASTAQASPMMSDRQGRTSAPNLIAREFISTGISYLPNERIRVGYPITSPGKWGRQFDIEHNLALSSSTPSSGNINLGGVHMTASTESPNYGILVLNISADKEARADEKLEVIIATTRGTTTQEFNLTTNRKPYTIQLPLGGYTILTKHLNFVCTGGGPNPIDGELSSKRNDVDIDTVEIYCVEHLAERAIIIDAHCFDSRTKASIDCNVSPNQVLTGGSYDFTISANEEYEGIFDSRTTRRKVPHAYNLSEDVTNHTISSIALSRQSVTISVSCWVPRKYSSLSTTNVFSLSPQSDEMRQVKCEEPTTPPYPRPAQLPDEEKLSVTASVRVQDVSGNICISEETMRKQLTGPKTEFKFEFKNLACL